MGEGEGKYEVSPSLKEHVKEGVSDLETRKGHLKVASAPEPDGRCLLRCRRILEEGVAPGLGLECELGWRSPAGGQPGVPWLCLDMLTTPPHLPASLRLVGNKSAGVPGGSFLKTKAAPELLLSPLLSAAQVRLHLQTCWAVCARGGSRRRACAPSFPSGLERALL